MTKIAIGKPHIAIIAILCMIAVFFPIVSCNNNAGGDTVFPANGSDCGGNDGPADGNGVQDNDDGDSNDTDDHNGSDEDDKGDSTGTDDANNAGDTGSNDTDTDTESSTDTDADSPTDETDIGTDGDSTDMDSDAGTSEDDDTNTPDKQDDDPGSTTPTEPEIKYNDGRITVWAGGIQGPAAGELVLELNAPGLGTGLYSWYETENTQWFNVAKTLQGDANMCWAIAAVNILHWWSVKNEDNISEYLEKNPPASDREYLYDCTYNPVVSGRYDGTEAATIPLDEQKNQSHIADIFRGNSDRNITAGLSNDAAGGYASDAFVWYLYSSQSRAPAIYKDVFGAVENPNLVHFESNITAANFTSVISDALDNNRVIAMDYNTYKNGAAEQHCINVWGAVFNNDGVVTELWVGDSNYKQNRLFNWKIKYKGGSVYMIPAYNDAATAADSLLNKKVLYITSFSDGSELFKQYI